MRIGIDGNEANITQRVGVNQVAYELIKHISKLKQPHHIHTLLKDRPLPDMPEVTGNFLYEVFGPKKAWVLTGLTLRLFKKPKIDVLFSPSHYIPLFSTVPRVFSIMDLSYEKFDQNYFNQYDLQQLRKWTKQSVKRAKKIITISELTKRDIVEIYNIPEDKVVVIYPGYNQETYHARIPVTKLKQVRKKYGITGKYFVFVGTLQPRKNIKRLIQAFSKLEGGTKLVIVGKKGWLFEDIFKLVKKKKLEQKVIFTDFAPEEDIPALLKGSTAFVLPSLYEGFGIPVIEAQASGAVTIVSRVSSLPEVASEAAIYINNPYSVNSIAESLREALSLPKTKRQLLIAKGKENTMRFSWDKAAKETLKVLEQTTKKDA